MKFLTRMAKPMVRMKKQWLSFLRARELMRFDFDEHLQKTERCPDAIVSLTSIPSRLGIVHLTIRSILAQTLLPKKIVLWLNQDLKKQVPTSLSCLTHELFEIRYTDLYSSHRKLVCPLIECFDEIIVTCDDDCMYDRNWFKTLYESHTYYPIDIIAGKCRTIQYDEGGDLKPYKSWLYTSQLGETRDNFLAIGYAGILYPANSMMSDVTDAQLFLDLAPHADDLWFKAMSYMNQVRVRTTMKPIPEPIDINRSQKNALKKLNVRRDGNYEQWSKIGMHYQIDRLSD